MFSKTHMHKRWRYFANNYQLYILLALVMTYFILFAYMPMFGLRMAFMDFNVVLGFERSKWVGLKHFDKLINGPYFMTILKNTVSISVYSILASWPFPIAFALAVNVLTNNRVKRSVQTIAYAPHFISTVVIVGMLKLFLSPSSGVVNAVIAALGGERINFFAEAEMFSSIYVWSGIWQNTGWNAVIYIAALSGIDPQLHEAATIDGASRLKRVWHIDLPGILPTMVILTIMSFANVMGVGFEKAYLMQNNLNVSASEVISTYSYKVGLEQMQFSFSTAVSMFNSVVTFSMLMLMNFLSKRITSISLW